MVPIFRTAAETDIEQFRSARPIIGLLAGPLIYGGLKNIGRGAFSAIGSESLKKAYNKFRGR